MMTMISPISMIRFEMTLFLFMGTPEALAIDAEVKGQAYGVFQVAVNAAEG